MPVRREIALLAIILAVAAALRFLSLDTVPSGWHHDEAILGLMASEVYRGVDRPIFFAGWLGHEPLYVYLAAAAMWLLGDEGILPLRLASAAVGTATVLITYLLGRELFGRRVGLVGAGLLAFSFWQLLMSRDGYRVVTQPLLEGLAILLLWQAVQHRSLWRYLAAGAALGGVFYTYLGARLFPAVLLLFALWWLVTQRRLPARQFPGLAIFAAAAIVVVVPLAAYFLTHPGALSARADQLSVFAESSPATVVAKNVLKVLAKFTLRGDALWRYNIPARPIFVGLAGILFYAGLFVLFRSAWRKSAPSALVLAWLLVMLFPSFFSLDDGTYFTRLMGLVPAIFLLPAVGLVALWDWVARRVTWDGLRRATFAFPLMAATLLAIEAGMTYRDYFDVWANSTGNAKENMADMVTAGNYLATRSKPDEDIFVSSSYFQHPTVAHLAPSAYDRVRWIDGNNALVLSPGSPRDSLYLFPVSALPDGTSRFLPAEAIVDRVPFADGTLKFIAYRLRPADVNAAVKRILDDAALTRVEKVLGSTVELLGYRVDKQVVHNSQLSIDSLWRVLRDAPPRDYVTFFHLISAKGGLYAQSDTSAFRSSQWRAGDIILGHNVIGVKDWVPAGPYYVATGVYDRETKAPLAAKEDATGAVRLETVDVVVR